MRQKVVLFLYYSVPFTLLWALLYRQYNPDYLDYIVAGTLFGLFMTATLTLIQYVVLRVKGIKGKANVVCSSTFLVKGTQSEVFELCRDSVKSLHNCKLGYYDPKEGFIRARTPSSWKSFWGEEISFRMVEAAPETFRLFITSRPVLRTVIIDFGVNLDHINRLKEIIKNNKQLKVTHDDYNSL